jgi:hypothetical protein
VWYTRFKDGQTLVEDSECSGRPSGGKKQIVRKVIRSSRHLTVREVVDDAGILFKKR